MKLMKPLAIVMLAFVAAVTWRMAPTLNIGYSQPNTHDDSCTFEHGLTGAEDITIDHEHSLALIATDDRRSFLTSGKVNNTNGALWSLDLSFPDSDALKIETDLQGPFHPHGISLYIGNDGERFLFVINHISTKEHDVNIFKLLEADKATLVNTVRVPEFSSPNDLHAISPTQFFVTNDHYFSRNTLGEKLEDFLRLPSSNVLFYDGNKARKIIDGLYMANGITSTNNHETLYVAESLAERVSKFERNENGDWVKEGEIDLGVLPDNLEVDEQGALLVASHPRSLDFLMHTFDESVPAPSIAQRVALGKAPQVDILYYDSGDNLSGSSVAATHNNQLLVGTVFDDRVARCQLPSAGTSQDQIAQVQ